MVVWVIGLAGAGKTTVAREVVSRLRQRGPAVLIDGDDVRAIMGNDLGHTLEDRLQNAWRICRLCRHLDQQGISVVCAILSLFPETQDWNRDHFERYYEVFLDVPMEVLERRDQKGLYSGVKAGRVTQVAGVDLAFTPPPRADLRLSGDDAIEPPAVIADAIVAGIDRKFGAA